MLWLRGRRFLQPPLQENDRGNFAAFPDRPTNVNAPQQRQDREHSNSMNTSLYARMFGSRAPAGQRSGPVAARAMLDRPPWHQLRRGCLKRAATSGSLTTIDWTSSCE